jgi:hypothetical protein
MEFCEACQTEVNDCPHLRRAAHVKECRDAAWDKVVGPDPHVAYATGMWRDLGCSNEEVEYLLSHARKYDRLGDVQEREERRAQLMGLSVPAMRSEDRRSRREMQAWLES